MSLPFRPDKFTCVPETVDLSDETIAGILPLFAATRLSPCSQERFHLAHDEALARGMDSGSALREALFSAAVNEIVVEALAAAVERHRLTDPDHA